MEGKALISLSCMVSLTQGLACAMWGFANTQGHVSAGDKEVEHQPKVNGRVEYEHEEQGTYVSEATAEEEIEQQIPTVDERLEGVISRLGSELERRAGDMDAQQVRHAYMVYGHVNRGDMIDIIFVCIHESL